MTTPKNTMLCTLDELAAQPSLGVDIDNQRYIVIASDEGPRVYLNSCPHLGIPLEWLEHQFFDTDTGLIRCATHGALFLPTTGECVSGPCAGDSLVPVPFVIKDNNIFLAG